MDRRTRSEREETLVDEQLHRALAMVTEALTEQRKILESLMVLCDQTREVVSALNLIAEHECNVLPFDRSAS